MSRTLKCDLLIKHKVRTLPDDREMAARGVLTRGEKLVEKSALPFLTLYLAICNVPNAAYFQYVHIDDPMTLFSRVGPFIHVVATILIGKPLICFRGAPQYRRPYSLKDS